MLLVCHLWVEHFKFSWRWVKVLPMTCLHVFPREKKVRVVIRIPWYTLPVVVSTSLMLFSIAFFFFLRIICGLITVSFNLSSFTAKGDGARASTTKPTTRWVGDRDSRPGWWFSLSEYSKRALRRTQKFGARLGCSYLRATFFIVQVLVKLGCIPTFRSDLSNKGDVLKSRLPCS